MPNDAKRFSPDGNSVVKRKLFLDITKSVEENAQVYFEKSKHAKHKLKSLLEVKQKMLAQAELEQKEEATLVAKTVVQQKEKRAMHWYEKFRWCFMSNGMLAIGGRDATTNELVIKKHTRPHDVVFHTDMAGSPFIVLITEGKPVDEKTLLECAQFCAVYSRAWGRKISTIEVFSAKPEQLSKTPNSGESLGKGAFVIRGKLTYFRPVLALGVGVYGGAIMGGPPDAIATHCPTYVSVLLGDDKVSDVAKKIVKALSYTDLDAIIRTLPAGGVKLGPKVQK